MYHASYNRPRFPFYHSSYNQSPFTGFDLGEPVLSFDAARCQRRVALVFKINQNIPILYHKYRSLIGLRVILLLNLRKTARNGSQETFKIIVKTDIKEPVILSTLRLKFHCLNLLNKNP